MLNVMKDIGGVELPESLIKLAGEDGQAKAPGVGPRVTEPGPEES
jgi:hypothetical protein